MATRDLVQSYYDSLAHKDDKWQGMYVEEAFFADASLTLKAEGRPAVIQSFTPFLKTVEGVKVKQMIVEGNTACAIVAYVYVNPKGAKLNQDVAEVWEVKGEKLAKLIIYFDLTEYRAFMRS